MNCTKAGGCGLEQGEASESVKKWAPTNESVEDLLPVFQERIEANASGADMEMGN